MNDHPSAKSKTARRRITSPVGVAGCNKVLQGHELLADMEAYRAKVAASPESARNFLMRLGVMTAAGTLKTLTHG